MSDSPNKVYIQVLIRTLEKKQRILKELKKLTERQDVVLGKSPFSLDAFEEILQEKEGCIRELTELDEGFEKLYLKVKEELQAKKHLYRDEITSSQKLIAEITDIGVAIEALEQRNKNRLQLQMTSQRKEMKQVKQNSQTVASYYKNMANQHQDGQSYFMDKKK